MTSLKGYVYLFKAENGLFKIGCSINPDVRVQIFSIAPVAVKLFRKIRTNNMRLAECLLHRRFQKKRVRDEWFSLNEADLASLNGNLIKELLTKEMDRIAAVQAKRSSQKVEISQDDGSQIKLSLFVPTSLFEKLCAASKRKRLHWKDQLIVILQKKYPNATSH